ncbi:hypothetical protein ACFL2V_22115, partial [Pseudomonadota bacterium]
KSLAQNMYHYGWPVMLALCAGGHSIKMKLFVVAVVSFLVGAFSSTIYLSDELKNNQSAVGEMVSLTKGYLDKLDEQRSIDRLEKEIKTLSYLAYSEQNGTPFRMVAIDMAQEVEEQINKVTAMLGGFEDEKMRDKAKELIENGAKVIEDVKFYYE